VHKSAPGQVGMGQRPLPLPPLHEGKGGPEEEYQEISEGTG